MKVLYLTLSFWACAAQAKDGGGGNLRGIDGDLKSLSNVQEEHQAIDWAEVPDEELDEPLIGWDFDLSDKTDHEDQPWYYEDHEEYDEYDGSRMEELLTVDVHSGPSYWRRMLVEEGSFRPPTTKEVAEMLVHEVAKEKAQNGTADTYNAMAKLAEQVLAHAEHMNGNVTDEEMEEVLQSFNNMVSLLSSNNCSRAFPHHHIYISGSIMLSLGRSGG